MKLVVIGNGMGEPAQGECLEWHSTPVRARSRMAAPALAKKASQPPGTAATAQAEGIQHE